MDLSQLTGHIWLDGEMVRYGDRKSLRALRDRMAIVFQQYNLFQNMTVMRNVTITPIKVMRPNASGFRSSRRCSKGHLLRRVMLQLQALKR